MDWTYEIDLVEFKQVGWTYEVGFGLNRLGWA